MDIERLIKKKKRVKRDGNLQQLAEIVKELGDAYFESGKYEDALQEYTEQLETCNILEDKLNVAVARRMIGEMYVNLGSYEEALKHQTLYLGIGSGQTTTQIKGETSSYKIKFSSTFLPLDGRSENFTELVNTFAASELVIFSDTQGAKEIKNSLEEQRAYATLGRTYFCWAESLPEKSEKRPDALTSARKAYMKSIRICNELGETDVELKELITMRARLLLNLGLVLEAQKEHREAIDLMEKAAGLCETHNLRDDFHRTQIALGGIYERKRDYELALIHFEAATGIDNSSLKAEARFFQAELLLKMERWHESRKILVSLYVMENLPANLKPQVEKCLRIVVMLQTTEEALSTEKGTSKKLTLYETLGDAAVAASCFEKAIEYYRKMLACAEEIKSDRTGAALLSLAQTLKDVGRYNEALDFACRELELCTDPREICRSALFLADLLIFTKASNEKIQEIHAIALKNAKACNDVSLEASALKERLDYLEDSGQFEEIETLRNKLNGLEQLATDTESDDESEAEIGTNICLEDLSDVEAELKVKENVRNRKRARKKSVAVKRNEKGETQLHVACINGNIETVEKLLESGHVTNVRDHFGWTPLHEAANHGHVEVAKLLLKYGADVNDPGSLMCQGVTPLHDAASCGNLTMMRLLIEHGANVELKTNEEDTVLDCLEQWRNRVDVLSTEDQVEYDQMHKLLLAMIPESKRKNSKRSKKSPRKARIHIIEQEEEEDVATQKMSAGEDYKRTIASLKHRNDPIGTSLSRSRQTVNPLLNSEEILLGDWLEDDMNESVANKRHSDEHSSSMSKRKSSNDNIDAEKSLKRAKANEQNAAVDDLEDDALETQISDDSCDSEIVEIPNERRIQKRKQQMCLLSVGFTKETSRTPSPVIASRAEFAVREIDATKSVILNVSVDGKAFKTQVEFSNTTRPSIQEIVGDIEAKFFNDTGCKGKLELKTTNGIVINCNNVFTILNEGDIVKHLACEIVELETPSIVERYGTICKNYNLDVRECIVKCLKSCENSFILRLKQEDVKRTEFVALLKTLEYQKNVQILDLSGGELHEIARILNNCILRLPTLQELCLQSCDIDSKCLSKLEKLPSQLKFLDLSYNPLGPTSQEILCKLLIPLTQLRTLNLRYCQLRNLQFLLDNSSLVSLDISWNSFDEDQLCIALQRQLLNLSLSNTVSSGQLNLVKSIFGKASFSFVNLECLELASCELSDIDVQNILSRVSNLSKLVLRGNRKVGVQSLNLLLKYSPTLRHIDVSGCENIVDFPDSEVFIENPEICTLIASMYPEVCECWVQLWRGKGVVKKLPHNLTIFKPLLGF